MMSEKLRVACVLAFLLTFSVECLSNEAQINNLENFYVKANYFGALFNNIGSLEGKEDAKSDVTDGVFSINKKGRIEAGHNPKYVPGFAGGASIGYSLGDMRVELEGLYSQTDLYDKDYSNKNHARYVELRRKKEYSVGAKCGSPWVSIKFFKTKDEAKVDTEKCDNISKNLADFRAAFRMKNEGFNNLAGMVNVYYDFNKEEMQLVPYVGVGGGLTKVKFLGRTRYAFAYQAKLGANYQLTAQVQAFAGLRYFGILGNEFKDIVPVIKILKGEKYTPSGGNKAGVDEPARIESTTATITNRFGIYGLDFGLTYHF
ncbi:P44/Msp2 family outer membrane protein [Wolbachia endosymbiont of Ctenocephalides felis wCfeJ]|uniref:P44/Msp2 family outer membrane protein n=1 Tax=Wolbachia endosymbiont of Ctenocephalides felis wCfeJ TaxID=2732594 RepID=UPI001582D052|nr:P44/Msp2 family outer membrane protein [Wolbachia endosymbiont of Ctenocephalides felis wCfeJ]WCR57685.1 MAG: Major surface antigen 4 [Wolbachia endosymbiont of Ctenocephalides felis wCfeJ]